MKWIHQGPLSSSHHPLSYLAASHRGSALPVGAAKAAMEEEEKARMVRTNSRRKEDSVGVLAWEA